VLTRCEQTGAYEDADVFLHKFGSRRETGAGKYYFEATADEMVVDASRGFEQFPVMKSRKRELLPFIKTPKDALALCRRTKDNFYLNAFMIECWLGKLACETVAEYAEKNSASDRKLQTGEARREQARGHTLRRGTGSLREPFRRHGGAPQRAIREIQVRSILCRAW
jgi:hypothetical protein